MFISLLLIVISLYLGFKWGKQESKEEESRKNLNHEPIIFSLEHEIWEKTQKLWLNFIDSLDSEDIEFVREKRDILIKEINLSFNKKLEQLKRTGLYPKKKSKIN